jgi:dihydroorotate dehydrogenase (fumarate)
MNLRTTYLGIELRNPVVASASPLSQTLDGIRRLEDAGVAAVVLHSLFEEQVERERAIVAELGAAGTESYAEALSYLPALADGAGTTRRYLSLLERSRGAVGIPVIGSLNGVTAAGWTEYAVAMEEAGASAIELNMYDVPGAPDATGREVEQRQIDVLQRILDAVHLPVAVKMSPYLSSAGEMAARLDRAGARGLVLFNRFMQPDIDPETLQISARIDLSTPADQRLPLTWIAILRGRVDASLAASGGVDEPADVARYLLAGADVVMTTSALLRHGRGHAATLIDGLVAWMHAKGFASLGEVRGLLCVAREADPAVRQRAGYVGVLESAARTYEGW